MRLAPLSRLAALTRHLPFAVDDYDAARAAYARWRETRDDTDRQPAALWAYCYVVRYFTIKFVHERAGGASDYDAVVGDAVRRVFGAFDGGVREPDKFPQFVSVVCKRVLLTHRGRRHDTVEADEETLAAPVPSGLDPLDRTRVRDIVVRAVDELPASIREVAALRLLRGLPYSEIADALDLSLDTVRTYFSKAIHLLRERPDLRELWFDDVLPESVESGGDSMEALPEVRSGVPPGLSAGSPPLP